MDTLRLTRPMMHGPAVVRLQELGILLGADQDEADGIFGSKTEQMVREVQKKLGLTEDGVCGPMTWAAILAAADAAFTGQGVEQIVDRRGKHPDPKLFGHTRLWRDIEGVTLHQTGCQMPLRPEGWDRLNAHIGITRGGTVVLVNDPTAMIWHAQGLSKSTIGIEIAGNFQGIDGRPATLWKGGGGPDRLSGDMQAGLDVAFNWLLDQFKINGCKFRHIFAHRQSANARIGDPGSEIWQKVAKPWLEKLGATAGDPGFHLGSGRSIPSEWDENLTNHYWDASGM